MNTPPSAPALAQQLGPSTISSALKLVLAGVVRDFWMVEERENVFKEMSTKALSNVRIQKEQDAPKRSRRFSSH